MQKFLSYGLVLVGAWVWGYIVALDGTQLWIAISAGVLIGVGWILGEDY